MAKHKKKSSNSKSNTKNFIAGSTCFSSNDFFIMRTDENFMNSLKKIADLKGFSMSRVVKTAIKTWEYNIDHGFDRSESSLEESNVFYAGLSGYSDSDKQKVIYFELVGFKHDLEFYLEREHFDDYVRLVDYIKSYVYPSDILKVDGLDDLLNKDLSNLSSTPSNNSSTDDLLNKVIEKTKIK